MPMHEIYVTPRGDDPAGREIRDEARRTLGLDVLDAVWTARVYRLEDVTEAEAKRLAATLFADPVSQTWAVNEPPDLGTPHTIEVGFKPGVMNPEVDSITKAAAALGVHPSAVDSSTRYAFSGEGLTHDDVKKLAGRLLVNEKVQQVIDHSPPTLRFTGEVGPVNVVPIRKASDAELEALSKDKLFLDLDEMRAIKRHFNQLWRDPTDAELETIAARWSEHCGHKTFNAKVMVNGQEKTPLYSRIKNAARRNFGSRIISAFNDNSGVMRFYDGWAICGKVETHNSPSAIEPYGGAMTGSGGVFRDIMGTGQGAETLISTDMFCFAPPDLDERLLPTGTLHPDYLQRGVVRGVRDYGNRMGIPTANGSIHFHDDFRAKPTVIVGAYGILPEARAQKGEPRPGDLVVTIGGRTGRDGIHGATFSSGEMTDRTASVNASAVQIGNAIEEKRMFDALLEARDQGLIRALTDCGAAGFSSAIGEMGEHTGVTVDLSRAPTKYPGLAPWEIWLSESQERMVAAIAPNNIAAFMAICQKYNVEATVLGNFDDSQTLTVTYGEQPVINLDYEFLREGLPQRIMQAHWERTIVPEVRPARPETAQQWVGRVKQVLAHGNVCSKEPVVRQYDHGVRASTIVSPFGGVTQEGPNDAYVMRPLLDQPYGIVQAHGMNPILNRIDPYEGTVWAITEAAANYVSAGGNLHEAAAVGNYIWPFPDAEAMGSLDQSVDAAVEMMDTLGLPVISGKDSLSSTYRGKDGLVIKIPPVYTMSIFGRIPDVAKTMTTDVKQAGSRLVLVGKPSKGMAGSTYYDIAGGSSNQLPTINRAVLPKVLNSMQRAIASGKVLACHDVSEGGVVTAVAEMCFGSDFGAKLTLPSNTADNPDAFLFNETAGCFVVEVPDEATARRLFKDVPHQTIGITTAAKQLEVHSDAPALGNSLLFDANVSELKAAWQAPMKGIFH